MIKNIAVLPGDGIGPEITEQSLRVLNKIAETFHHTFHFQKGLIGSVAIDTTGNPCPPETHTLCKNADAVLLGAIGDPKYDNNPNATIRPEQGLLALRKSLHLYANVRPIYPFHQLLDCSPLKPAIIQGTDFIVIRELIGGIYYGKRGRNKKRTRAFDTNTYSEKEIIRVATYAFLLSQKRNKQLTVIDKANVLETSRLWRETIQKMEPTYPDVTVSYMFIDNAAMQLIKNPVSFNVIVTENMFGDILTDEASVLIGSLGMLPSASIGIKTSLFEPIHGSFPRAAGKNVANPIGSILSAAMMLSYSFGLQKERDCIYNAVEQVLNEGYGTKDITKEQILGTSELTTKICEKIDSVK